MTAVEVVESEDDNHATIIRLVLAHPRIDVNKQNNVGETAIHMACGYYINSHVGAQLLLNAERCDVNLQDDYGRTALMQAVKGVESEDDKHKKSPDFC